VEIITAVGLAFNYGIDAVNSPWFRSRGWLLP